MTLPIQTDRLVLRRFTHDDVRDVIAFVSHPSVAWATPEIEPTESGAIQYIDRQNTCRPFEQGRCFDLALERKQDGRVIGLLSLVCKEHMQEEIGWGLAMRREAHLREAECRDGEWVDVLIYGILAPEWQPTL
jgi:RimJ/RimL family protein N-acetyltransferase